MIIICKECSTKFRLDESLLKETGSKVRCSVCKYIFTAYPPDVLGKTEPIQPISTTPQGYFDSEESLGHGGVGGFQKTKPDMDDDDDGLELDVGEEDEDMDEDMDDGLDLGDDNTEFDDDKIGLGNDTMPGIDTDFDDDNLGLGGGMPGLDFDDNSDGDLDEIDLDKDINLDLEEELEPDTESDLQKESVEPETRYDSEPVTDTTTNIVGDPDEDPDFEFEFELDDETDEVEDAIITEELTIEDIDTDEEKFDLSIDDDDSLDKDEVLDDELILDLDESSDTADEKEDAPEIKESEDTDQYESMVLEIDESDDEEYEEYEDDDYEIEDFGDVDEEHEDDDYEIENFGDVDEEYQDDDIIDEEYEDDFAPVEKPKKPAKKIGKPVKILLILFILLGIAYGAFTVTGGFTKGFDLSKINFSIFKNLVNFSKMEQIPVWATINNQSLNGRYVNNEEAGQLFVITGEIINESSIPLNHIQVEGILISKGGVVAKKKKVFCGNKIPEGQMSTWSVSAINRVLQKKDGEQGSNLNIKTNESIPFMIVFSNLPKELENYTVTVVEFNRMPKK